MATVVISPDRLERHLMKLDGSMRERVQRGLQAACLRGRGYLVRKTPVGISGVLKAAWRTNRAAIGKPGKDIATSPTLVNDAPYAAIVELGARPHPVGRKGIEAIALWAQRKLRLAPEEAMRVAQLIAHKIRARGQKPTYFVKQSIDALKAQAQTEVSRRLKSLARERP